MDISLLKNLVPINSLTPKNFEELAAKSSIEDLEAGSCLFKQGETDPLSIYLLSGEVVLLSDDEGTARRRVVADTDAARYALAQLKPRQYTGIAKTPVKVAYVDSRLLDQLLTWDQAAGSGYEVDEINGGQDADWMVNLLRSEVFRKLPPANVNALFARFAPVEVKSGQIIIRQGEAGELYYLIKSGEADVLRKSPKTHKVSIIARLKEGDGFGEEALLSGTPRNATVVMATDGVLMRLQKRDFDKLLRAPLVKWLTLDEVKAKVQAGAGLLDVRLEDEYLSGTIKGSVNLPLYQLRSKLAELDPAHSYVVFCQTGNRSCAAAFLLSQRGFTVFVLQGGLDALAFSQ